MVGKSALFVDLDSMNVLIKFEDKFVAALNYSGGLNRLGATIPALGVGYDIYLCLKPRAPGEGDLVIHELSITGLPFTVDSSELYQVLTFFMGYAGVNDLYLCNWVNNYIQLARVKTFQSAIYYGERIAFMDVKDGSLTQFKLFKDQPAFEDFATPEYSGYGDLGLLDVVGFKAQYPEFSRSARPQLVAVAPLAHCYRTTVKLNVSELYERLKESAESGTAIESTFTDVVYREVEHPDDPNLQSVRRDGVESQAESEEKKGASNRRDRKSARNEKVQIRKATVPVYTKVLVGLCCMVSLVFGIAAGTSTGAEATPDYSGYIQQSQERVVQLQNVIDVYTGANDFIGGFKKSMEYCQYTTVPITIVEFSRQQGQYVIRYLCASESEAAAFSDYVGSQYTVVSTNDLGVVDSDGVTMKQFTLSFI